MAPDHQTPRAPTLLWLGLALVGVQHGVTGAWALLDPAGFFARVPTVDVVPPYNDHLVRDVGAGLLALVAVIAAALWRRDRGLAVVALAAVLTFALPHAAIHLAHGIDPAAGLGFALSIALPVALLLAARPSVARVAS